jgi:hypothetical protein
MLNRARPRPPPGWPLLPNSSMIIASLMPSQARKRDSCNRKSLDSAPASTGIKLGGACELCGDLTHARGDKGAPEKVVVRYQVFAVEIAA